ncbi:MAG TPA: FecR domain-containing protein, partial [Methylomirabilota bacterium]|nr:FecR domain-containing protein [Methylomirabilota bacterium]
MLRFRRPAVALLLLLTFWPTMALGQAPKAGVVTTLEGNVSAARRALPQPIPLKFKDDVFLRDKITTGDQSLARLLLGGKAIVTIRERSILTVTELPGRSTVDLESGKIGLAVARDRMRQGEVIDVRTPNAIVAVRGTVLIAEVSRVTAQAGGTPPAPVTEVHLVSGTAEATVPGRPPFTLNEFQKFRVTGTAPPVIGTFTAGDLGQIQSGLKPKGPQHQEAANADQVKGQLLAATATLLTTVLGGGAELVEPVVLPPPLPTPVAEILPGGEENLAELVSNIPPNIIINPALSAFANLAASAPTPVVQTPSGTSLAIPGSAFEVQATGGTPGDLTRPLFDATNSNLAIGANLLNVLGTLNVVVAPDPVTGNPPPPVLSFDPT